MSRIPAVELTAAPAKTKATFDAFQKALGTVPEMVRVMAQSPAVLDGYVSLSGALAKGALGGRIGEQIALLSAETNGCDYCASAHTVLGGMQGLDAPQLEAARVGHASDARAQAALTLARSVLESRGHIGDATFTAARESGLSDGEIGEVVAHVALNVFTNYFNSVARTDIDFPVVHTMSHPTA